MLFKLSYWLSVLAKLWKQITTPHNIHGRFLPQARLIILKRVLILDILHEIIITRKALFGTLQFWFENC